MTVVVMAIVVRSSDRLKMVTLINCDEQRSLNRKDLLEGESMGLGFESFDIFR